MDYSTGMTTLTLAVGVLSALLLVAIAFIGFNYFAFARRVKRSVKTEIDRLRKESTLLTTTAKDLAVAVSHYNNAMTCKKLQQYEYSFYSFALTAQIIYRIKDRVVDDSDHFESSFLNLNHIIDIMERDNDTFTSTKRNFERMLNAINQVDHKTKNRILSFMFTKIKIED